MKNLRYQCFVKKEEQISVATKLRADFTIKKMSDVNLYEQPLFVIEVKGEKNQEMLKTHLW